MAQRGKKSMAKGKAPAATSSNDNMLWMVGFVMLILGILSIFSVLSHFIHWSSDLAALRNDEALTGVVVPFENICSSVGANIGYWLVDCSFGVFGLLLPIVVTLLGWRIFRKKALHFNHLGLSAALLLVVGAVTMGLIGEKFDTAYDIGGRWGHACATDLTQMIGTFGVVMVLLTGWILTGVYINRNVISLVNRSVDGVVHKGEDVVGKVKERIARRGENQDEPAAGDNPVAEPVPAVVNETPQQNTDAENGEFIIPAPPVQPQTPIEPQPQP
ncbi:MAG: DNA translocase FtsK 4TM domain-containing protein, partial [Alistipes sp.]|nr:DNA translocase FtsK 4TM domain-containing protein [Alistipes sp.]